MSYQDTLDTLDTLDNLYDNLSQEEYTFDLDDDDENILEYEKNKKKVKGIYFNKGSNILSQVNGPITCYLIEPTSDIRFPFYLPTLLLFGDDHFSFEHSCTENQLYTYGIHEPSFYQLFQPYSTSDTPIDVYLETFDRYRGLIPNEGKGGYMGELLSNDDLKGCFARNKRIREKQSCVAPTLRWHLTDVRQQLFRNYEFQHIEDMLCYILELKNNFSNINTFTTEINKRKIYPFLEDTKKIFYSLYDENFMINMSKYSGDNTNWNWIIKKFIDTFFDVILDDKNHKHSLIAKQILKKQTYISIGTLKMILTELILFDRYKVYEDKPPYQLFVAIHLLFPTFDKFKEFVDNPSHMEKNKETKDGILSNISKFVRMSLMDFYFICRVLKSPKGGIPPALAIAYFGDAHIKGINHIFSNLFKYDTLFSQDYNPDIPSRCININKSIEMSDLIKDSHKRLKTFYPVLSFQNKKVKRKSKNKKNITRKSKNKKSKNITRKSKNRKSKNITRKSKKSIRKQK